MMRVDDERLAKILEIIQGTPKTTKDIQEYLDKYSFACPEDLVRILNKMKRLGTIKGGPNTTTGGWSWWMETDSSRRGQEKD